MKSQKRYSFDVFVINSQVPQGLSVSLTPVAKTSIDILLQETVACGAFRTFLWYGAVATTRLLRHAHLAFNNVVHHGCGCVVGLIVSAFCFC